MRRYRPLLLLILAVSGVPAALGAPALAADPEAGKAVFQKCHVCHAVEPGKHSPLGPSLHGLFGRRAGTVEGYKYSEAMQQSGITWDDKSLAQFLRSPRTDIPGTRMAFPGLKSEAEIDDLLAYLHQATQ